MAILPALEGLSSPSPRPCFLTPSPGAQPPEPLGWIDRAAFMLIPTALLLAQGAVITSVGLALATWMCRLGRAMA